MASGPITSWQIEGEKVETEANFMFLGSKITADSDCSHEIKRHLLLGSKAMTDSDSILKNRVNTLLTKVHLVKAIIFPVVMYGCELDHREGWAPKNWCFWIVVKKTEGLLKCKIKWVNPKEISPEYSLEGLMLKLKLQHFGHLMEQADWWKRLLMLGKIEGKRRRGQQKVRSLDSVTNSMDMNLNKPWEMSEGQGSLACYSPRGRKESDTTVIEQWQQEIFTFFSSSILFIEDHINYYNLAN